MATNNGLNASALRDSLQKLATREGISSWDLGAACSDDCSVQVDRGEAKQLKAVSTIVDHCACMEQRWSCRYYKYDRFI